MRTAPVIALGLLLSVPASAQTSLLEVNGPASPTFGMRVDLLGDVSGDGIGDLLVSDAYAPNGALVEAGCVYVCSGADGSVLYTLRGAQGRAHFGTGASAVGDVNGDGFGDLAVGASDENVPQKREAGRMRIFSGLDGSLLHQRDGARLAEYFGTVCAAVGDVDGDGRPDVLVSAPGAIAPDGTWGGALRILSGADGSLLLQVFGDRPAHLLGNAFACGLGDVNGDGRPDFGGVQQSTVRIFSGADGSEIRRHAFGTPLGVFCLAGGLDANGDGFADYVFGHDLWPGWVEVRSGFDGTVLLRLDGDAEGTIGRCALGLRDVDGDGYGDVAIGLPYSDGLAGSQTGQVRAYSGRTGRLIARMDGVNAGEHLAYLGFGGGRDWNGDRYPDLIVSARLPLVRIVSLVPRGLEPYGVGTAGCTGELTLLANGSPAVGSTEFEMHVSHAGEVVTSLLLADVPDVPGAPLYNALFHVDTARLLARTQLPIPDAHGSLAVLFPIPADAGLIGLDYYFQAVTFFGEGRCARRIATSPGLRLTFQ